MSDVLEKFTEIVASATRDVSVTEALVREYRGKLRMAEEELSAAHHRLSDGRRGLEDAVVAKHEAIHGQPISVDDRLEFEKRWDAHLEEIKERHRRFNASRQPRVLDDMVSEQMLEGVEAEWAAKGPITEAEAHLMTIDDFEAQVKIRGVIAMVG